MTRFDADEFVDGASESFGRVFGWIAAIVLGAFLAVMAVAVGIAGWWFFVHQLQK